MLTSRLSRRFEIVFKDCIARGLLPFDWGADRALRQSGQTDVVSPRTFSEKVRHKLRHDRRPIVKIYADKLAVRDYVRAICPEVKLPRLISVHDAAESVVANVPRGAWVMKASHGSGMVLICNGQKTLPQDLVHRRAQKWLRTDYSLNFWEWQYHRLPRRVLFEEYLGDERGVPPDYKLYVIHQKVRFLEIDQDRFTQHTRDFFHPDWTPIHSRIGPAPLAACLPPRPPELEQMISVAETLACDTDFLRVDLYDVRGAVYFGELTHSPAAGHFGFADEKLDEQLGRGWKLPTRYR
ncbi:MAG TPA: ATP-grasp fold amidoligase family protein [Opitutus sp.]|nr:ATP-grasp fold amidoligase family protein [Opitutus sp.]